MQLYIASPTEKREEQIAWIEFDTFQGNFVVLAEHAPMILTLLPLSNVLFRLKSGKEETKKITQGVVHITRNTVTLLLTA